jgi:hypothetical protein
MPAIHYLAEYDRIRTVRTYKPVIMDMTKNQLEILALLLINETDIEYAFDISISSPK